MINKPNLDIDLTVIGNVLMADGIGRQSIGLIQAVHEKLNLNTLQLPPRNYKDIPQDLLKVFIKPFNGFGKVSFWTFILGTNKDLINVHKSITSPLKIAYSMFESDAIPPLWTHILNSYYDMVVVPDPYLISVYKNSGVKIPIFMVPLGIMIEDLLNVPQKEKSNDVFTFGMSAGFWRRKNHIKILQSFGERFGNDPKFKLKLHGRSGPYKYEIEKAVRDANYTNVELITSPLSVKDYNSFMEKVDCYVFPSMGEGFSITPREVMALGKPCIVSNNSSHGTICKSGLVIPINSIKKVPDLYEVFGNQIIGNFYDCNNEDLTSAMVDVVNNYEQHLTQAKLGREWVKQYLWSELQPTYLNLFKPQNITLTTTNLVTHNEFKTNDSKLYNKIKDLF
jgi:glycosyltransferase involved in cell wall biosynthesis